MAFVGSDGGKGIGHAQPPAIWLSDGTDTDRLVPPPTGRDHWWATVKDRTIGANPGDTLTLTVAVAPATGLVFAIAITPTVSSAFTAGLGTPDPYPWLRFTATLPDGTVLPTLTADEFNAFPDRGFTVCNVSDGTGPGARCGKDYRLAITLDSLAPYTIRNALAKVRITFDGMTTPLA